MGTGGLFRITFMRIIRLGTLGGSKPERMRTAFTSLFSLLLLVLSLPWRVENGKRFLTAEFAVADR